MSNKEICGNIRDILKHLIGQRLLDITQQDQEDIDAGRDHFIELMFENGDTLKMFSLAGEFYKARGSFAFSDPDKPDGEREYTPNEEDAKAKWNVVEWRDEDGIAYHNMPTFGRRHIFNENCWCGTSKKIRDDGIPIITHNEEKVSE
jgi:hypothetical protein